MITELLYFANYTKQEFEPVLDERMIVYTYLSVDPTSVEENYDQSEDYEILMSRLLYVDRAGDDAFRRYFATADAHWRLSPVAPDFEDVFLGLVARA